MTLMYGPAVRRKRASSIWRCAVLHQSTGAAAMVSGGCSARISCRSTQQMS